MTPSKISQKIAAGKIELIERFIRQINQLDLLPRETFIGEAINVAAGESYLRRSIEALIDLGRHILARAFGVPAVEYGDVGPKLAECGVVDQAQATTLSKIGRYRNRLVHMYDEVTPEELHQILTTELVDLTEIAETIKQWLAQNPDKIDTSL